MEIREVFLYKIFRNSNYENGQIIMLSVLNYPSRILKTDNFYRVIDPECIKIIKNFLNDKFSQLEFSNLQKDFLKRKVIF